MKSWKYHAYALQQFYANTIFPTVYTHSIHSLFLHSLLPLVAVFWCVYDVPWIPNQTLTVYVALQCKKWVHCSVYHMHNISGVIVRAIFHCSNSVYFFSLLRANEMHQSPWIKKSYDSLIRLRHRFRPSKLHAVNHIIFFFFVQNVIDTGHPFYVY